MRRPTNLRQHFRRTWWIWTVAVLASLVAVFVPTVGAAPGSGNDQLDQLLQQYTRTLDGRGNNVAHPTWGSAGTPYLRVAKPAFADGKGAMMGGPSARYVSNRIFNDNGQNLFSENDASQWVWIWGQFIDHDFGLRDETSGEHAPIKFDANDPLESFRDDYGMIDFYRTPAAPGTGTKQHPRNEINQISSFIDGSQIYGNSPIRLDWMRVGPVDKDPTNNSAKLLMSQDNFLPRPADRGKEIAAPVMDHDGPLREHQELARIAGDVRANENMPLTLTQTLFAREHNRIVDLLPSSLSEEEKFEIARLEVGAEIEFITYNEFLPAMGVKLPDYTGYKPDVNPSLSNEFAAVGYRAHSMVHGEIDPPFTDGEYSDAQLTNFRQQGIGIVKPSAANGTGATNGTGTGNGATTGTAPATGANTLEIPLVATYGNPDLLGQVGIGKLSTEFGAGHQYRNDEMIDNSMRSVLFQVPKPGARDPKQCGKPIVLPDCFSVVQDLGAIDLERGRDHGIPTYNELRKAYGLAPKATFDDITGENTEDFPTDSALTGKAIDNPKSLDFTQLQDINGNAIDKGENAGNGDATSADPSPAAQEQAVFGLRRTTTAARLKAIYGNVNKVDAFVGMLCEPHPIGEELGELQRAMWREQFTRLRDGDRLFIGNNPLLTLVQQQFGITYQVTLSQVIQLNTQAQVQPNAFKIPAAK